MHRHAFQRNVAAAMVLIASGFPASASASCSSYMSAPNEATVTCTAATDVLTVTQRFNPNYGPNGAILWAHEGPSSWIVYDDAWDDSYHAVTAGGTIRFAGLNGASLSIGDQTYTPADALNGQVILNQASGGGNIIFESSMSGTASTWIVNDGSEPFNTTVNSLTFTNNSSANLTIHTGGAMNLVNVWSVAGSDTLQIIGHGNNEVDVGNSTTGTARAIYGPVRVDNLYNDTNLVFHDWNDGTGRAVTYRQNGISGLAPADIAWSDVDVSQVTLYTGSGADTVTVQSSIAPLAIHGTSGSDTVTIGSTGSVAAINGPIHVDNAGSYTRLVIDDSADATPRAATLGNSGISGIAPAPINWQAADINAVTLNMGIADDSLNVLSTASPVTIQGTGGHDTVKIGNGGNAQGILGGTLDVRNFLGRTALTIDDSADTTRRTATYTSSGVTGLAPNAITWPQNDVSAVTLALGTGNDTVNVLSVYSGSGDPLTIHGTSGVDAVYIGDAGNSRQVLTPVMIDNSAAYTSVWMDNSADPVARDVSYTSTGISGVAPGRIGWKSSDIGSVRLYLGAADDVVHVVSSNRNVNGHTFVNVIDLAGGDNRCVVTGSGLGLNSTNSFYGGNGDDEFMVSAVAPGINSINLFGGSQNVGDTLVYTGGNASGAFPGNGTLTPLDPNAHAINYNSIEAFSVNDVIFRDGFE